VLPRAAAFWLVAFTTAAFAAASSAPSPLYPVYQVDFGFSSITLTAIFAVYVFALMASLLTVGRLSDYVGRRVVFAGSLVVEVAAMLLFLGANGVAALVSARIVQGFATGAAFGVLGAYLLDLQPGRASKLGSLLNSVAPTFGLGLGAVVTGILVQYAPHPTRLIFAILLALFLVLALATVVLPETMPHSPGALATLRPQIAVPPRARHAFVGTAPALVATWAFAGLNLSVGGSLLSTVFGQTNHAVVGVLIGLTPIAAAAAAAFAPHISPPSMATAGTAALAIGTGLFLLAVTYSSTAAFILAVILAGSGFGLAFLGALRLITPLAAPNERGALLSAVYVVTYLAFSLPALVAGVLTTHIGLRTTALAYGGFVALVAIGTLAAESLSAQHRST
jgi:MFS family permease